MHDSGLTTRTGKITKAGRRDLRVAPVEAAHVAANSHPNWKAELARLQPRLGRNTVRAANTGGTPVRDGKAIVAIARKLLMTAWHVLARKVVDRFAESEKVSQKMLRFAYEVGKENRPGHQTAAQFVRERMDILGIGQELTSIVWGSKKPIPLPASGLKERSDVPNR